MRNLRKITAVLSSVVLAASMLAVPTTASAETTVGIDTSFTMSEEDVYYSDSSNIAWDNGFLRCYFNGKILSTNFTEYGVLLQHSTDTVLTAELLGLPAGYSVADDGISNVKVEDAKLSVVQTETYKEAAEISRLANEWLEDGLVTKASIVTVVDYSCTSQYSFKVELMNPEDTIDLTVYGFPAENIKDCGEGVYLCTLSEEQKMDFDCVNNLLFEIIKDSRVGCVGPEYGLCDAIHIYRTFDPIVPADAPKNTSFTMSEEEAYYSDPSNIAWTMNDYKCYKNGKIIHTDIMGYCVLLQHNKYTELTDELLGLPEGYSVEKDELSFMSMLGNNTLSMIETETYEEACEISKLANAWLEDGLVSRASVLTTTSYGCGGNVSLIIKLNNPEDTIDFAAFAMAEENISLISEGVYQYIIPSDEKFEMDMIENTIYALKSSDKVNSVYISIITCCVLHTYRTFEPILPVDLPTDVFTSLPSSYEEAYAFLDENAETIVSEDGKYATVVIPVLKNAETGEICSFNLADSEQYKIVLSDTYFDSEIRGGDVSIHGGNVYLIELMGEDDVNLEFISADEEGQEWVNPIRLKYAYCGDGKFKVSDIPTTQYQVDKFLENYGNVSIFDDTVVTVTRVSGSAGIGREYVSTENTPELSERYSTGYGSSAISAEIFKYNDGTYHIETSIGGSSYLVNVYNISDNGKYEIRYFTGRGVLNGERTFDYVDSYNYAFEKTDDGLTLVKNEVKEADSTYYGDVNFDTVTDLYDAIAVARYLMSADALNETEILAADFNRDGVTNLYDAVEIAKTLM